MRRSSKVSSSKAGSYKTRLYWALFRIILALVSVCFFLYFLVGEVNEISAYEVEVKRLALSTLFEDSLEALQEERHALVCYLNHIQMAKENRGDQQDDIVLQDVFAETQEETYELFELIENTDGDYANDLEYDFNQLPRIREATNSSFDVMFYSNMTDDIFYLWYQVCITTSADLNVMLYSDIYRYRLVDSIRQERDFVLYIFGKMHTLNSTIKFGEYEPYYYSLVTLQNSYLKSAHLYFTHELSDYFDSFSKDPVFLFAQSYLVSVRLQMEPLFHHQIIPNINITEFDRIVTIYENFIDDAELVEKAPDMSQRVSRFLVAVFGAFFEVLAVITLLWMAVPVLKLVWRLHFHSHSSDDPNKMSSLRQSVDLPKKINE